MKKAKVFFLNIKNFIGRDISLYGKMSLVNKELKRYDFDTNELGLNSKMKNTSFVNDNQYESLIN